MKTVRIATMTKHIEEADDNVTLFRIQEVLSDHRSTLIMRILSDLPTYLQFKFTKKVSGEVQSMLKDKLFELSNSKINLDRYSEIVKEIKNNSNYRVPSQEFFKEIDLLIDSQLNPTQLTLISEQ